jgi:acetolactate synthase-1/2/3 large subunit
MGARVTYTVSDGVAAILAGYGVDTIFCITGAGNIALLDALSASGKFRLVFTHHEQAALMAANGHARVTGGLGVAVVTTGGGAANALTGALSANMDSVPLLVLAGNESSRNIESMDQLRAIGVQGFDAVAAFGPATKWAARCMDAQTAAAMVHDAARSALAPRSGCVLLEVPMDIQLATIDVLPSALATLEPPVGSGEDPEIAEAASMLARCLQSSHRPLVYFGNGIRLSRAQGLATDLIRTLGVPFALSWSAIDLFDDSTPGNIGRIGVYGDRSANIAVQRADLVLCVGTRLAIPQVGYERGDFARHAQVWIVDVDPRELEKCQGVRSHTVRADAGEFLHLLLQSLDVDELPDLSSWRTETRSLIDLYPRRKQIGPPPSSENFVHSFDFVDALSDQLPSNAVVVTDVGAGLLTGHYAFRVKNGQRLFTSQGLGEMGFGLPAAIGAATAAHDRPVVCLNTDGGVMFNLQELQTLRTNDLPVKLVIFNNSGYGMIRFSQDALLDRRRLGVDEDSGVGFPNFRDVAETFGLSYLECSGKSQISRIVQQMLETAGPVLVEVIMDPEQRYLPKLGTARLGDGSLKSLPIEDLDPRIPPEELALRLQGC